MNISINGVHLEITPGLKEHTYDKFKKLAVSFVEVIDIRVNLKHEDNSAFEARNFVHTEIHLPGKTISAHSKSSDMYHAIDDVASKLKRQLVKHKELIHKHVPL